MNALMEATSFACTLSNDRKPQPWTPTAPACKLSEPVANFYL